ncbi:L-serine ammonia-lyase, iron-sulfur-dependent, subunit alpha [Porphyromonas sp. COT-239 OH1446]|uniref:L-serine ammonia-lyase, iron-sulfur-dependent, subunit alpha n=1 Tax=Porphyromonas sp. COT-239 OH1446 TaxID=1515613 RepID=UPI00052CE828|nr:L-serine ammonia-lyase, iron-sulfur-dependent, subunit alpha [Porphyromonas sp. COT-239 OH1446]KGN71454.1 serine dehydratase [Porphyromonas sp. COT-239 OH1446]
MESIKQIFRIGYGPSSSHTMGPVRAAQMFLERCPEACSYTVTLYGSLAATGKGHMTDTALLNILTPHAPTTIEWLPDVILPFHPNGMKFDAYDTHGQIIDTFTVFSIGGGTLANEDFNEQRIKEIYPEHNMRDIMRVLSKSGMSYWEYVEQYEDSDIWDFLDEVWTVMQEAILSGLEAEGVLPGGLGLKRKASTYLVKAQGYGAASIKSKGLVYAYALAVSEHNASGGRVVTAPTCGSCGVIPAVLYHLQQSRDFSRKRILRALATAGLFGNVVRTNASISGAEVGCQGEVGVACAMGAAAACQLFGGSNLQIEYSAEMGLEHHLGLTCDPVCGLVQIPCIERNAFAAARALDANTYGTFSDGQHRVSFDQVVEVMRKTGHDLPSLYRETSTGGLASTYNIYGQHID